MFIVASVPSGCSSAYQRTQMHRPRHTRDLSAVQCLPIRPFAFHSFRPPPPTGQAGKIVTLLFVSMKFYGQPGSFTLHTVLIDRYRPTFNICSSFNPFCISSCIRRPSVSVECSRKASRVLRLAYSLKLYAANCVLVRNKER